MKATHYIKEVKKSQAFRDFIQEDSQAYLCSLFFMIDFNEKHREIHVDFYSPKAKKIVSFKIGNKIERIPDKNAITMTHKKFVPKPLSEKIRMDIDAIKPTLTDEMRNREMTYEIEKILAFLNVADDRIMWNCTGFLKGLGLLQAHVEDSSQSVLFMDKKSLFDMIKFTGAPGGMPAPGALGPGAASTGIGNVTILPPEVVGEEPEKKQKPAPEKANKGKTNSETKKKEAKIK